MLSKAALAVASAILAVQSATLPAQGGKFIVGGAPASEGEFPYIVAILLNGREYCGGSLVNGNTVITAAHCTRATVAGYQIRAGSLAWASGGKVSNVSSAQVHPAWSSRTANNDIAVWKLSSSLAESPTIRYAKLPEQGLDPVAGSNATVAGWGSLQEAQASSALLQKVTVPIVARTTCQSAYANSTVPANVTDNMFCAGLKQGGKDSCQGDSGGPIVDAASGTLIGLVSWGQGCAEPDKYGVYTRLGNFVDFVKKNM
ncbi:trypsin-related protease [Metarhizium album ARSEF 1941]|uniref:Trypsin-related protease n=1 Tax=Metarhizium album (strain ARSEF 1941) TaxID=1081103 RepID=A0A0B2WQL7_METAS|nr:trypsin-related protease [Metarhizium album ARSEF 1941]KHN98356.1 trypsin-related protease [Metarhizium album ARSEF 1941]